MSTTRGAVVGRAWRLHLQPRTPCIQRTYGPPPSSDLSGTRTCMHPVGDPALGEYHYCGRPVVLGQAFCPEHAAHAAQEGVTWAG